MGTEPNTIIKLLFGVPLNPTYEGTLTFADADEQYAYFNSKNPIPLTRQSYQRYDEGSISVNLPIAQLYTCDYMMFQNASYDDKWFYAFVTNVEYINDVTTKVYYQIDVMQTWLLGVDWEFDNCFISREHVSDDRIGANILPEPFEVGDFELQRQGKLETINGYAMIIAGFCRIGVENNQQTHLIPDNPRCEIVGFAGTMTDSPIASVERTVYNQVYNYLPFTTASDRDKALYVLKQLLEGDFWNTFNNTISSVYIIPDNYVGDIRYINRRTINIGTTAPASICDIVCDGVGTYDSYFSINTDTYTPMCNKLYTEQFRTIKICGVNGVEYILPQDSVSITQAADEFGDIQRYISYRIKGGVYGGCGYRFTPAMKNGTYSRAGSLDTGSLIENPFTASEKSSIVGNALLSALTSVIRGLPQVRGTTKTVETEENRVNTYSRGDSGRLVKVGKTEEDRMRVTKREYADKAKFPLADFISIFSGAKGRKVNETNSLSGVIDNINGYYSYSYEIYAPKYQDIVNLDVYLNTFGYASNRVGMPNTNNRQKWNYVKTKWCNLKNSRCPTDALIDIKEIVNNGIMFWHGETNVNNYVLTNGKPNPNEVVN